MIRCRIVGLIVAIWMIAGLGLYEMTAKSPQLAQVTLPGWWATARAEQAIAWHPPTGVLPLDKLLHEGQEAAYFYATLAGYRSQRRMPDLRAAGRPASADLDAFTAQ